MKQYLMDHPMAPFYWFFGAVGVLAYILIWYTTASKVDLAIGRITAHGREKENLTKWQRRKYRIALICAAFPGLQLIPIVYVILESVWTSLTDIPKGFKYYMRLLRSLKMKERR